MFYNLAGCTWNPRPPQHFRPAGTSEDAGPTFHRCTVQNLLGRTNDIEEHDRMTNWLHQRQLCRARRS
ncbi:hypothetical protein [Cupriavidus sp. MP-37]|uniref:hypothetical protein n=1 Tax=Cupriavidus sp. MP-37 TaxID=2884455 RepID=UPI001D0BB837|nr:hypothetical protein [Cupriavidus sp. MP-37]UDM52603.1 hypothetical protein LIN44_25640 [Cupriavidus sp. MP-37]